ncbi:hypothetical protein ACFQZT_08775 [Paenibacillus sp. GCM10027628]|uniref:hypothetical protein n=1 Tax=Paenibacillus sp. GCM10027628 TaxID=3273413 RepID=UPI003644B030
MFNIVDFGRSVPAQFVSSIAPILIVGAPSSITIAQFGLLGQQGGQVLLNATVGTQATLGQPDLLYRIFRGNTLIFTLSAASVQAGEFSEASFTYVDSVASGYFAYSLNVEMLNSTETNQAFVVGPIVFSGLSLAP